jgi:glycosyltransferase 2 family protein
MTELADSDRVETGPPSPTRPSRQRHTMSVAGVACAVFLLFLAFRHVDPRGAFALLAGLGPTALVLLLPSVAAIGFEVVSWRAAFAQMGIRTTLAGLYRVRVVSDSLGAVLPLGMVWSDAVKLPLLARHCGVPMSAGIAGIAARKYLLVLSQAGYLLCGFLLGRVALESGFGKITGHPEFAFVAVVFSVALVGVAEITALTLRGGQALQRVLKVLGRVPNARLRSSVDRFREQAVRTDGSAARFFAMRRLALVAIAMPCWGGGRIEATETWLMLRALGSELAWGDAIGVEALVVLARHLLVVVPGGLGIQELGYATLLGALGNDPVTCAALALLKRSKELLWVAVGYLLLALDTRRSRLWILHRSA